MRRVVMLLLAVSSGAGCYTSHDDNAGAPSIDGAAGTGWADPGPAPGEGGLCPGLGEVPASCRARDGGLCDAEALQAALGRASAGDVVRVGRCEVAGAFVVPPGVTLEGAHPEHSVIVQRGSEPGVALNARRGQTAVRCLSMRVEGRGGGIRVAGGGSATVDHVAVLASRGVGLEADTMEGLRLHALTLRGPVTPDNVDTAPLDPRPDETATHGMILKNVESARLSGVHVSGFAKFGALFRGSRVTARDLSADDTLGTGVMVDGGRFCARRVGIAGTLQGLRLIPAYGAVFAGEAEVKTEELVVQGSRGYGVLQDESTAEHHDLVVEECDNAGLWVQQSSRIDVRGSRTRFADNKFGGIFVCGVDVVSIHDGEVVNTLLATRLTGEVGTVRVGDGVAIGRSENVSLENLNLERNERIGLVLDLLGPDGPWADVSDVFVASEGEAFGALAYYSEEDGSSPVGWDEGIVRSGAALVNDGDGFLRGSEPGPAGTCAVVAPWGSSP